MLPIVDVRPGPGRAGGDVHLAPQAEFVTEIMHSPRPSPSTGEGTRQQAQRRECTSIPRDHSLLLVSDGIGKRS